MKDLAYNETGLREEMRAVNDKDLHTDASERDLVCALYLLNYYSCCVWNFRTG